MKKKITSGFTLIELLVVIAIIGILAALVLVSLGNAREKAGDARVKSNIAQVRTLAEIYYDNNSASYSGFDDCVLAGTGDGCSGIATSMASLRSDNPTTISATSSATTYCVSAELVSDDTQSFAVRGNGAAGVESSGCSP